MKALKGLASIAQAGVTYRDYAPRVLDAKVVVDRSLQSSPDEAIGAAMRLYVFVSSAWSVTLAEGDYESIGNDRALADCPTATTAINAAVRRLGYAPRNLTPAYVRGFLIKEAFPAFWACASDKIAEAEKALGEKKQIRRRERPNGIYGSPRQVLEALQARSRAPTKPRTVSFGPRHA
jgi:uncharacterized protein YfaQ (DUF2300 family)